MRRRRRLTHSNFEQRSQKNKIKKTYNPINSTHSPAVFGDDHLVGEILETQPELPIIQRDAQIAIQFIGTACSAHHAMASISGYTGSASAYRCHAPSP